MEPFDSSGSILPGLHSYTYQEFVQQFVLDFPDSKTREEIFTLSFLWLAEVKRQLTPAEVWFSGAFITGNLHPHKLEMCVFLPKDQCQESSLQDCIRLQQITERYKIHTYFGLLPNESEAWNTIIGPYYWTEQFGFNTQHIPTGIVVMSWNEILKALI
ncbi:hypothetical protein [Ammoniphilus sp. YIM 78166]|uniref:DUF6932 family protein n=1 Tax=Ammoniphilus sp. YIM 78166 TaxID=1644106 RepID=UPI00142FA145|nr:hypothetical protein [Ammoniphilus sp. YIM 78166]